MANGYNYSLDSKRFSKSRLSKEGCGCAWALLYPRVVSSAKQTQIYVQLRHESTWKERWEDWSGEGHHQGQKQKEKRCWKSPGRQLGKTMISNDLSPRARDSMYTFDTSSIIIIKPMSILSEHLASLPKSIQFSVVA